MNSTTAQDYKPKYAFSLDVAVQAIGSLVKAHNISLEELTAAFPKRPTSKYECDAIARWVGERIKSDKHAAETRKEANFAKATRPASPPQDKPKYVTADMLPEGNYAVPGKDGGKTRFYRVSHKAGKGKWAGTTFVNVKERASDDLYDMTSRAAEAAAKWSIVEYGYEASRLLFAEKYDSCWHCFKGLTDENNPYKPHGLGPVCGPKIMG